MAMVEGNSNIISAVLKRGEEDDPVAEVWVIEEEETSERIRLQQLRQKECNCIDRGEGTSQSSDGS